MRHRIKSEKFSRNRGQRKALVKSLLRALFIYERIKTTESKAKGIKHWAERLITLAKEDTLHHRRLAYKWLGDHNLVKRLFEEIAPRFKNIPGGYTRVLDLGPRQGDGAKISLLELTRLTKKEKKKHVKKEKIVEPEKTHQKEEEKEEKIAPKKEQPKKEQPKKGLLFGVKRIFKKERDSLG
jgi:large subunit ribosomal protein L17